MKKITRITFFIYSKRNPKRFQYDIYVSGHITDSEAILKKVEYVRARNLFGVLLSTGPTIEYFIQTNYNP